MYEVYINLQKVKICETKDEAWDVIRKSPFGSLYEVRFTETNEIVEDFIPF